MRLLPLLFGISAAALLAEAVIPVDETRWCAILEGAPLTCDMKTEARCLQAVRREGGACLRATEFAAAPTLGEAALTQFVAAATE